MNQTLTVRQQVMLLRAANLMRDFIVDRYGRDEHGYNDEFIMELLQARADQREGT